MKRLLLAVAVMASGATASTYQPIVIEKVAVTVTPLLCAGLCPGFDLAVWSDGRLERHVMPSRHTIRRSEISAGQYAAFLKEIALIRPASLGPAPCARTNSSQYDIVWSGSAATNHLRICSDDIPAAEATTRALRALQVDSDGFLPGEPDSPQMISYG